MKGKFITFEGADGGGKSTQVQLAATWLRERGYEVVTTREPGGTVLAEKVRELVLDPDLPLNTTSQTLLYLAARRLAVVGQELIGAIVVKQCP